MEKDRLSGEKPDLARERGREGERANLNVHKFGSRDDVLELGFGRKYHNIPMEIWI
jgi:hypothetical protein